MINIATILTCFNRREKTVQSLQALFCALDQHNQSHPERGIALSVYLTDDACTDGTAQAVAEVCEGRALQICQGDGNCFWAGGMRLAWREALRASVAWDFFLLLNDDTIVMDNVFNQLFECHDEALRTCGKGGLYSGATCSQTDTNYITYGGKIMDPATHGWRLALPNGKPQQVDNTQANILLVSRNVVDTIGIFHDGYIHGAADEDYSMTAVRHNLPAMITAQACGYCEFDHMDEEQEIKSLIKMSLSERRRYVKHPTHCDADYLEFIRRNMPRRYRFSCILRKIRLYCPRLYYRICKARGIY